MSIPNISNTSIILNLLKDKFTYTPTGLLDNTHIRFYTLSTFCKMLEKVELSPVKIFATYSKPGENEIPINYDFFRYNGDIVKRHFLGEVYQYIYEIKAGKNECHIDSSLQRLIDLEKDYDSFSIFTGTLYYDNGDGYSETLRKSFSYEIISGRLKFKSDFTFDHPVRKIRLDLVELYWSKTDLSGIKLNGQPLQSYHYQHNGLFMTNDEVFFASIDPKIEVCFEKPLNDIKLEINNKTEIFNYDIQSIRKVEEILNNYKIDFQNNENENIRLQDSLAAAKKKIHDIEKDIRDIQEENSRLLAIIESLRKSKFYKLIKRISGVKF